MLRVAGIFVGAAVAGGAAYLYETSYGPSWFAFTATFFIVVALAMYDGSIKDLYRRQQDRDNLS